MTDRDEALLRECYEWLFESKADGPRVSEGALTNGSYTPEFRALHDRLAAALRSRPPASDEADARRLDAMATELFSVMAYDNGWKFRLERGPNSPWSKTYPTPREAFDAAMKERP
jgi:hypothetical protein